ncbi:META domain-containing protein [uncultured Tateyamaria sp.]|uniref:META domain-containing protein n=1 Tax=Tateyamaria sp. 1078 TaxID=3417464 RepID=UPI00261BF69A|nr:META domain-containing protein [uncultured Tateyamaria sp.]
MRPLAGLCAALLLCACQGDAQDGFGDAATTWQLVTLDGAAFDATATLTFPEAGRIAGSAPCNQYFGPMNSTFPGFSAPALAATRRACPALEDEIRFLAALRAVTRAERADDALILSDETGARLVFRRAD